MRFELNREEPEDQPPADFAVPSRSIEREAYIGSAVLAVAAVAALIWGAEDTSFWLQLILGLAICLWFGVAYRRVVAHRERER